MEELVLIRSTELSFSGISLVLAAVRQYPLPDNASVALSRSPSGTLSLSKAVGTMVMAASARLRLSVFFARMAHQCSRPQR